ncbi:Clp protease ClpP [Halalkalibacterium halodurans]|nr:head maturation protease, ClpP-related [Halalkalibacterium halodurans]MDY7224656.1 Clp protease ClpP [Halalkalibacterium halodurans]MDY7243237.1 Clp protease ClpP [Halalkalibacterium halodurans]
MSADGKTGDIFIYGEITQYAWEEYGEKSAKMFQQELEDLGVVDTINLYVNSPGGSVFEGVAIHNMLKRHSARVIAHVDALAASIASVIIMSANEIRMPSNSMLMIHNPWTWVSGNAADLRKAADDLDRIGESAIVSYLAKAGDKLTEEKLREMLDAETWLMAEEAYQYGLCDVVEEENKMVASISEDLLEKYKNVPKQLVSSRDRLISDEQQAKRQRLKELSKSNLECLKLVLGDD